MPKYTFGDIPDDFPSKEYLPLNKRGFKVTLELGWEHVKAQLDDLVSKFNYDTLKFRLDSAIQAANDVISGKISQPDKTLGYTLFPPGGFMRSDLQQGSMKLLYGESVDVSYIGLRDDNLNVQLILNGHLEDGIPVDWWIIAEDDEIMDRRHLKTGIKLRNIVKKSKKRSFQAYGELIRDILLDIRNERTPQWADSAYQTCVGWGSFGLYLGVEFSYYEAMAMIWDVMAAKRVYGLPDAGFAYVPMPTMISMVAYLDRALYTTRMVGLTTDLKLAINGLSEFELNMFKEGFPTEYEMLLHGQWEEGVPYPKQSLEIELPNLKKKKRTEDDLYFKYKDPIDTFIHLDDLGLTFDEAMKCVLVDIDNQTEPGSVNINEKIISLGIGYETKFF